METIIIHIGIGQIHIARFPARLVCVGLGSCVAVALWDSSARVGGMAHIMLPDSKISRKSNILPGKFGDTAAKALLDQMKMYGVHPYTVVAKIAGGANMFKNVSPDMKDIGRENVKSVKRSLKELQIKLVGEDIGGTLGRTVELDIGNGDLIVKTIHGKIMKI